MRFKDLPIKRKLTAIIMMTCILVLVLISVFFVTERTIFFRSQIIDNITTLAEVIGINTAAAIIFDDQASAGEVLASLNAVSYVMAADVFLPDNRLFALYRSSDDQNAAGRSQDQKLKTALLEATGSTAHRFTRQWVHLAAPIRFQGRLVGRIYIKADLGHFYARMLWHGALAGVVILIAGAIALLLSGKLQRLISGPVTDLARTANTIRERQDYTIRARKHANDEIGMLIDGFNAMLEQIELRDEELSRHREHLEDLVAQRTLALNQALEDIKNEMAERQAAEMEKNRIESQLFQAQKMEAIGTLAGGVAHDLNNILCGLVSFPELLLMQLDPEDPLCKSVELILHSGNKALAVVQDLLALARRGVNVKDVINLTDVVEEYLKSPECATLNTSHPLVRFRVALDDEVWNIIGSRVHIFKILMNLCNNAAEAMPTGGEIHISTRNLQIAETLAGFEEIPAGRYVVLRVKDTGVGILPEDLRRIFEPFFTKKKMGRKSGTGLGMAVVWGTVKDHNGLFDITSQKDRGTTFDLYFPVTTLKPRDIAEGTGVRDIKGQGEKVLVVDDTEEQRVIAVSILRELNYEVAAVESGEEALTWLEEHPADLLVLDMIMDPGIDGLETYRRIIAHHPGQKAIIVSGFSETGRVREAQRLGAGAYVRKPYSIRNLGAAIRQELDPVQPTPDG